MYSLGTTFVRSLWILLLLTGNLAWFSFAQTAEAPVATDRRILVELFAEHPQIVTPTGIAVDQQGRVFVAESHTHFRPDDYDGPPADRILIFDDSDGDGRADRRSIFHQGMTHVMDIELHDDGSLYVATRMDIHRLQDTDGDNRADVVVPIVRMETTGTYPHNGLSGLAFDFQGNLNFGLGENLGHDYTLIGSDGTKIRGGGEGGSTYHVNAEGTNLRRVSTGWWNPFGMCVDAFGRVFGTDNDPGASPPCRLIQVVEGGDYGYEYRYGRTGLHPLISWTAEIPGTLPMIAGTGEAPCAVLAYESDALPDEYRGQLLVASWADHRVEHYPLVQKPDAGLVDSKRQTLVEGGNEFRPVGLAVAPDGTVYVSDWVSSSYQLHKQGRIWRIRPQTFPVQSRPPQPRHALLAKDGKLRESAARQLVETTSGRQYLRDQLANNPEARVRSAALQALTMAEVNEIDLQFIVQNDPSLAVRVLALRQFLAQGGEPTAWLDPEVPTPLRVEALRRLDPIRHQDALLRSLESSDPLVFHAAVDGLSQHISGSDDLSSMMTDRHPLGALLALKRSSQETKITFSRFLKAPDPNVRYLVVKWIADQRLQPYRSALEKLLSDDQLDFRTFLAASAALDRLDGREPTDRPSPKFLLAKIRDEDVPVSLRRLSLRLIDPHYKALRLKDLTKLVGHVDPQVRIEAVRTLAGHPDDARFFELARIVRDQHQTSTIRATAIAGLAPMADRYQNLLVMMAGYQSRPERDEALRALVGIELSADLRQVLSDVGQANPDALEAVHRILEGSPSMRPSPEDMNGWLALVNNEGDASAGERVFFGTKVGMCAKCHEMDGRGVAVGPDLTMMNRRLETKGSHGRRWLLETILQPSKEMAPQYTPWMIVTTDGRTLIGLPRRKGGKSEAYLGEDGREFSVRKEEIELHREIPTSIMPQDLLKNLTQQELCDLMAFLTQSR